MPRRKPRQEPMLNDEPILALPPARPAGHPHEHRVDPYQAPPGAVPQTIDVPPPRKQRTTKREPLGRELTPKEKEAQVAAREEARFLGARYNRYLDALIKSGGDQVASLAAVFDVSMEEAYLRRAELHAEARKGMGSSDASEIIERADLGKAARVEILKRLAYSGNAAATINALKLIQEEEGDTRDAGSFEAYLRLCKMAKGN